MRLLISCAYAFIVVHLLSEVACPRQAPVQGVCDLPEIVCVACSPQTKPSGSFQADGSVLLKEPGNGVILKEVISWMNERVK